MASTAPRSFRLETRTNKQIALLAGELSMTQTDVIEMAVGMMASQYLPGEVDLEPRPLTTNEGLAREYDEVASIVEADTQASEAYRESVSRLMRGTARMLRGEPRKD